MAIENMDLPKCDVCGEVWLPQKGPARSNPREFANRCGKCKNPNWDRDYRKSHPVTDGTNLPIKLIPAHPKRKCQHNRLRCPVCHKAEK